MSEEPHTLTDSPFVAAERMPAVYAAVAVEVAPGS